jgi:hypothetical protein
MTKRILLLLAFAGFCFQSRAVVPPPERLLPKDTVLLVTAPDWPKAWAFVTNSQYGRLWQDPAVRPFRENFVAAFISNAIAPTEKTLDIKFVDFQGLAQGQVTFALLPSNKKENPDGHFSQLLILDTKSHSGQLKTNLAAITKKWIAAGKAVKTQKIREVEFTTLIISPSDLSWNKIFPQAKPDLADEMEAKAPDKNTEITFGQVDSLLIASDSPDAIEKVLTLQNGGLLSPLAEQSAFQSDFAPRLAVAPIYAWVNVKALIGTLTAAPANPDEDAGGGAARFGSMLTTLGLDGVTSASVSYQEVANGAVAQFFLGAPESKRGGILKLLTPENKDANPPPFVPADAVKFWRWRLDIPNGWARLEALLNDINPQLKGVVDAILKYAGKDKDEHYDLKSELLSNLGDDLINYEKGPKSMTMPDLNSPPSLFLIGSPNPDKLVSAISVALGAVAQSTGGVKDREFLGRTIHSVTFGAPGNAAPQTLNFSGSGGYVAMSGDAGILEEFLRSGDGKAKSLMDTQGLGDMAQQVGGFSSGWFGYENQNLDMRPTFELLRKKKPTLSEFLGTPAAVGNISVADQVAGKLIEWSDFSLLPPFDTVSKYFYYSVYAGHFSPDGFSFKIFAPTPPGLR